MSRLIKEQDRDDASIPEAALPLSKSVVVSLLRGCQSIASEHAHTFFPKFLKDFDDTLNNQIDTARDNKALQELSDVQRRLRQKFSDLERYFSGYLSEGFVKFKKAELHTTLTNEKSSEDGEEVSPKLQDLTLVSHDDLDESLAISSISQRAEAYFAEPLWALNQRFAILNEGDHVTEASNPASPIQFCESLRKSIRLVAMDVATKTVVYKCFDDHLIQLCHGVTRDTNEYLKSQGILPYLKFRVPSGAAPKSTLNGGEDEAHSAPHYDLQPEEPQTNTASYGSDNSNVSLAHQAELLDAIRHLQAQIVTASSDGIAAETGSIVDALSALQAQDAQTVDVINTHSSSTAASQFNIIADKLVDRLQEDDFDASLDNTSVQTIDLVGMVFEYMLNDENLPDRLKAKLSHLHTPFLKIAFIDPGFFEQGEHPARVLLNSLADAGAQWVGNDGTVQYGVYDKIKHVVNRVVKEFDSDLRLITEILMEFRAFTKNIIRRQELMEKRATEKVQGEDKLREVKVRVNSEIRSRTQKAELPSAVLLFLLQPWSDYLSFALLRYGEASEKWRYALRVVDDLLWAIKAEHSEQDKARQRGLIHDLSASIETGLETIGYDQDKSKKLLDALILLIKRAVQSKKSDPAPRPMRAKLEKIAAEKAGAAEEEKTYISPDVQRMIESLKMIEFGTWFEFEGGKRLKVSWFNARTSHYMLVDQMGKRVDMMSGVDMARKLISKEVKIISGSSKPFFERALENIYSELNQKAKADNASQAEEEPQHE